MNADTPKGVEFIFLMYGFIGLYRRSSAFIGGY